MPSSLLKRSPAFARDVIEYGELRAQADILDATTQSLTQKRRPCPPGFSIGHPDVTAGTLGAWVHRGRSDAYFILSNNHILASSNDAEMGRRDPSARTC